jgi:hypothetical protein
MKKAYFARKISSLTYEKLIQLLQLNSRENVALMEIA